MAGTTSRKRRRTEIVTDGDDQDSKHTTFTKWSQDRGVQIHNVKPAILPGRGVGLMTTGNIQKDKRILFIPEKAMFKPDANVFDKSNAKAWTEKASPQAQLAVSMTSACKDPASQYHKWRATWPTPSDLKSSLPLFWPKHLQQHLPTSVHQPLDRQREDYAKDLAAAKEHDLAECSEEEFGYCWSIVNSRSFHFKPSGSKPGFMVLCPFIDYMNHGPSGTGVVVRQMKNGYEVTADRDYDANQEILATYGSHPNDKLLIHYGFILPSNGNPDDDIRLDHIILPHMPPTTTSALQDTGFFGNYALLPATNELCFKTQVAVRAMLLTANEWEYFIANGEDLGEDQSWRVREWVVPKLGEYRAVAEGKLKELEGLKAGEEDAEAVRLLMGRWRQILEAIEKYLKEGES